MIKRVISSVLLTAVFCCLFGCGNTTMDTVPTIKTDPNKNTEQNDTYYIVHNDWITVCFSKSYYDRKNITEMANEAFMIAEDIRTFLNAEYSLEEAAETVCYFDSAYRYNGDKRSYCSWDEKVMYCVSLDDFVHEYVHMVCENNADLLYHPDSIYSEGIAQYVSLTFFDSIASREYDYFKEKAVSKNSNPSEHQALCTLLSENGIDYNAANYNKAFVALLDINYDISKLDKNDDFYKYYIGHVFVDYCINQLGGLEKFISVYCDSVTVVDIYGKALDELVIESCEYNTSQFYGK